jgi:FixJ family two-component response regulator
MQRQAPSVFIVDDDREVCAAMSRLLSAANYGARSFESAESFLTEHDPDAPGCLLLDYFMPGMSGLELQQKLIDSGRARPIVFLTGAGDVQVSVSAMKVGAVDFLTKPIDAARLFGAVEQALERDARERRMEAMRGTIQHRVETLTPRERQVLSGVVCGRLNKQIAAELGTGEKTVKVHRARMMSKMDARSIAQLVQLAGCVGIAIEPVLELGSAKLHWCGPDSQRLNLGGA